MQYAVWLFGLSIFFVALERGFPRRPLALFRRETVPDLTYLLLNGEYLGIVLAVGMNQSAAFFDGGLRNVGVYDWVHRGFASSWPVAVQFVVILVAFDLVQYTVHVLMHRVPLLWRFHKVHHSSVELSWIANWRFHFAETLMYRAALYPVAAFFGFSVPVLFAFGLLATFVGHFTHSNLSTSLGPLRFILNGPHMHSWHHVHPDAGPVDRNFGMLLSVWDFLFGTAYLPKRRWPERLGFQGVEAYPT